MPTAEHYLQRFESLSGEHAGPAPWTLQFSGTAHEKHVLLGGITHGNETGSLPALIELAEGLAQGSVTFGGRVTIMLGNVEACRAKRRFLEADLNRVFLPEAPESMEKERGKELMPIIEEAHLFVDFHQTIEPSEKPFYIFPFHTDGYQWARIAGGGTSLITRHPAHAFAKGQVCADEYARNHGIPGITLEMGQKGLTPEAEQLTRHACARVLKAMDRVAEGTSLEALVDETGEPDFEFIEIQFAQTFESPAMALTPGLQNFTWVTQGQILGTSGADGKPLRAPQDGYLVFPKYPNRRPDGLVEGPVPSEIYNLATLMAQHPVQAYGLKD
ncbi:MAG: succinylglutamate desuccinylase/aspartoacylase family protein [Myxococcota bacterium]|nr:succinylglutamate desuccinylase/aspartoacylase family protein [Myxococcota bacterium]